MSEERQHFPTLVMWQRILRIRQEMDSAEGRYSQQASTEASLSLEAMQEALLNEAPDIPFKHWNPFEKFSQWDKAR